MFKKIIGDFLLYIYANIMPLYTDHDVYGVTKYKVRCKTCKGGQTSFGLNESGKLWPHVFLPLNVPDF